MEQETKSGPVEEECGNKEEAFTHLAQGKRHLLVKDYQEAVTSLGTACDLLSKLYGDLANECGEAYFNYGKALLELARSETGVLGIDGEHEDSNQSEGDEEGEGEGEDEKEGNATETEANTEENGKSDENKSKDSEIATNASETNGQSETDGKDKPTDEEEDDADDLRLAWQMLEMAKIIFQRQAEDNKQMSLKLAEVHLKLGEVGLESENYPQAIEDINKCLEIQLQNLDEHDRCIAETHYQLGTAYTLSTDFDDAIEQYTKALNKLQRRVEYLEGREKQGLPSIDQNESNPFYSIKEEIAEINALLPEVKEKILDVQDFKKEATNAFLARLNPKEDGSGASSSDQGTSTSAAAAFPFSSGSTSESTPVSNISHLVRKKRKPETDSSEMNSSKKPCPDGPKPE